MKTWLITGCSSGIGRGIAQAVLAQGDQAAVTARDTRKLEDLAAEYPDRVLPLSLEVTEPESVDRAVRQVLDRFGTVDVLVNNAGHGYRSSVEEGEDAGIQDVFAANFFGPVRLIRTVLPHMRAKKTGAIVNVSSIAAVKTGMGSGYYAASKAALEMVSEALYKEVTPLGIKVMIVEPGAFRTRFFDDSMKGTAVKIPDYADTAGKRRKENIVNNHDQPGDPEKGGRVIVEAIGKDAYPRRLLLGSDAVRVVSSALNKRTEEVNVWKEVSKQSDF